MAIAELWEALEADPADWHHFYPAMGAEALAAIEKSLGLQLPISYRRFLEHAGAARLFHTQKLLGLGAEVPEETRLLERTSALRESVPTFPAFLQPFADTDDGLFCFITKGGLKDAEYPIALWDEEDGPSEITHESFDEWLFDLSETLRDEMPQK